MHFNDLNDDVIEIIFCIHVCVNNQTKVGLLLTCRRWYAIALNVKALWKTICVGNHYDFPSSKVIVGTVDSLLHAIERAGDTPFELRFAKLRRPFEREIKGRVDSVVQMDCLRRCRSLILRFPRPPKWPGRTVDGHILKEMISNATTLETLESITWTQYAWASLADLYSTLLARAESLAPHLKTLKVECDFENPPIFFPILYAGLFGRIQRLQIISIARPVPWELFPNLEHLEFIGGEYHEPSARSNLSEIAAPNLTSLYLGGRIQRSDFPEKEVLQQLERLAFKDCKLPDGQPPFPSSFPSLTYLEYRPDYDHDYCLSHVSAPELEELMTSNRGLSTQYLKPSYITPRILRLTMKYGLKHDEITEAPAAWSKVEELHLDGYRPEIPHVLTNALSREAPDPFPRLRVLTVRYIWYRGNVPPSGKEACIQELRAIVAARRDNGLSLLERVELGWYIYCPYYGREPYEELCVTHWTDCLQD